MVIGTRVLYPEEIRQWDAELIQISVYRGMEGNLDLMRACTEACREARIPSVLHPVGYSLLDENLGKEIRSMAPLADVALILHDERGPDGGRLEGGHEKRFRDIISELSAVTSISFENATDTRDVRWFWKRFSESITLDIGHVESSGLNSLDFVHSLDRPTLKKIEFVHVHRNNGLHGGITDHWPITPDCRELRALEELVKLRPDVKVIFEINETEKIENNLNILRALRDRLHI